MHGSLMSAVPPEYIAYFHIMPMIILTIIIMKIITIMILIRIMIIKAIIIIMVILIRTKIMMNNNSPHATNGVLDTEPLPKI